MHTVAGQEQRVLHEFDLGPATFAGDHAIVGRGNVPPGVSRFPGIFEDVEALELAAGLFVQEVEAAVAVNGDAQVRVFQRVESRYQCALQPFGQLARTQNECLVAEGRKVSELHLQVHSNARHFHCGVTQVADDGPRFVARHFPGRQGFAVQIHDLEMLEAQVLGQIDGELNHIRARSG